MKILTLEEVIALPDGEVVEGMSGLIDHIGPRDEKINQFTKLPYFQQMIVLKDGKHRVVVMVDNPQDKHVGSLQDSDKGKKLYMMAAPDKKGVLKGLKRGTSKASATRSGVVNHYVYANDKAELEWAAPTSTAVKTEPPSVPVESDPLDLDGGSFENATPAQTNVAAQLAEKIFQPAQDHAGSPAATGNIEAWRPVNLNPAAALQLVVTHYESCVEEAINLCNRANTKIGVVAGEAVNTSPADIIKVADSLFTEANRRRVW